jgi:hypothetical protein
MEPALPANNTAFYVYVFFMIITVNSDCFLKQR